MSEPTSTRRNIYMDDDLHRRIQQAALREGVERGEPVSVSEWIREACEARLDVQPKSRN